MVARPIKHAYRPRPYVLNSNLPLPPLIPPQYLSKLSHQLAITKERPTLMHKPRRIDDILRKQIHKLQELIERLAVVERMLHPVEEVRLVCGGERGWRVMHHRAQR